ncbi:beta strand repeat-containing protein [Planctomycetota bacterium]
MRKLAVCLAVLLVLSGSLTSAWAVSIANEDYEGGTASGWTDNTVTDSGHVDYTKFLGRFSGSGGSQSVSKTFTVPAGPQLVTMQFDFYRIDSWDNEYFRVYIDDAQVANHQYGTAAPTGVTFLGGGSNQVFSGWADYRYQYQFTKAVADTDIKLGFGATLNSGISDESWGIDNVLITSAPLPVHIWDGAANSIWSDAARWTGPKPPNFPDATVFAQIGPLGTNNTVTIDGVQAAIGVEITGTGALVVGAGNTLNVAQDINAAGRPVTLEAGASLRTPSGGGTVGSLTASGNAEVETGGTLSVGALNTSGVTLTKSGGGTLDVTGTTTLTSTATHNVTAGTLSFSGQVNGAGGITKNGSGLLQLGNNNGYSGPTTVNSGILLITNAGALGNTAGDTVVNNGGQLRLDGFNNGTIPSGESISIIGNGVGNNGAIYNLDDTHNIDGAVSLLGNARIRVDDDRLRLRGGLNLSTFELYANTDGGEVLEINNNPITGSGKLRKEGDGTIEVRTNSPGYTGIVDINNGVVDVNQSQGLGTGKIEIDGDATLRLRSNITLANNIDLSGSAGSGNGEGSQGRIRNDANNNILSGTVAVNANSRIDTDGGTTLTLSGAVSGSGNIDKADSGRLNLTNTGNTFTGQLKVNGGTVGASGVGSLGSPSAISVASGSTLEINNVGATVTAPTTIAGDGQGGAGAINSIAGSTTFTGPLTINGTTISNTAAGTTLAFTGPVSLGVTTDVTFAADGDITVDQGFGNGSAPVTPDALSHFGFHNNSTSQLYVQNNGGVIMGGVSATGDPATHANFEGHGLLTNGPGGRGLDFNNDTDFRNVPASIQDDASGDGFVIDRGDNYLNLFWGTLTVTAGTAGVWTFDAQANDDQNGFWIDLDRDGIFESTRGGLGDSQGPTDEQITWDDNNARTVTLAEGEYMVAFTHREGSGGSQIDFEFRNDTSHTSLTNLTPGDPSQAGMWKPLDSVTTTGDGGTPTFTEVQLTPDNDVVKTGSGTVTFNGDNTYNGTTTVEAGTLLINGNTSGQGDYFIEAGATLGGDGSIGLASGASVQVQNGADLEPGGSTGILGVNGNLSFSQDAALIIEVMDSVPGTGHDQIVFGGDLLELGGAFLEVEALFAPGPLPTGEIVIIDVLNPNAVLTGQFRDPNTQIPLGEGATVTDLTGEYSWTITYEGGRDSKDVVLVDTIPEPATLAFLGLGGLLALRRRRRSRQGARKNATSGGAGMRTRATIAMLLAVGMFLGLAGTAQATTITGTAGGPNGSHDTWNNAANWDAGIPSGAVNAVVGTGVTAQAWNTATPVYTGTLTLENNATLQMGWTTNYPESARALGGSGVTMNDGSALRLRLPSPSPVILPPIAMAGDASIHLSPSTSAHHRARNFDSAITGTGELTVTGNNNNTANLNIASPGWSGGFVANADDGWRVEANVSGAFGTGDVTFNARAAGDRGVTLQVDAADVIADTATLFLNGPRDQRKASKLILNADETVTGFSVDGAPLAPGAYSSASGLVDSIGNPLITGSGILTVTGAVGPGPVDIPVHNGSFEELYKPGTAIPGVVSGGGWTQGVGPDCPIDSGQYEFSDSSTGTVADIAGWIGADRDGWIANGGTYGRDQTTGNLQGSVARQSAAPDGVHYYLSNGGGWGNPAGGLIVSDAPLATVEANATYILSMLANGSATPIVLDLLAGGVVVTPTSLVDPTLGSAWQEFSRTYDPASLAGFIGQDLTIQLGVGRGAAGDQSHFDSVQLKVLRADVIPEPATLSLLGLGALLALRRRRRSR